MLSLRRSTWIAGAFSLAALSLTAPPSSAACSIGQGWDLFRTGSGTYYNPIADALGVNLGLTNVSFKGVPVGQYDFSGVGIRPTGPVDTIVERSSFAQAPSDVIPIELVALQLQADGLPDLGLSADLPVYVTLQSARGGAPSLGSLQVQFDPVTCRGGIADAHFTVAFDVRILSVTGPVVLSSTLELETDTSRWTDSPPTEEIENCHPHTIQTGVHCTLGPPVLIPRVNVGVDGGDFYLGRSLEQP